VAGKKLVFARVCCINRATKEFFDRDFWLDLSTLPDGQRACIEELTKKTISPEEFVQVRPFLKEGTWADGLQPGDFDSMKGFAVTDYFEDEAGNALDMIGLAKIMSGEEYPILLHDVRSVLRLGPTGICRKEQWSTESANALAHFFQLVEVIGTSEWLKSDLSIGTPAFSGIAPWINSFQCPDLGQMYSILLPIRQLYASDDAFNHACNVYMRFAKDDRKRRWIKETKKCFNAYLDSVAQPHAVDSYTVRELLDLVMYGAGLVHYAQTNPQTRQHFQDAITRHHRECVIFTFIMYCREVYRYGTHAYFVLRQDYENWLAAEGCQPPDLVFLRGLFASHRLRGDDEA
jgi:hypothetical protein